MKKILFKIFYLLSMIFIIVFVILLINGYRAHIELLKNPLVLVAPFEQFVKNMALRWLIPAGVCAVVGLILQKNR